MTLPVLKFTPIDGSPASVPRPLGAASLVNVGGTAAAAGATNTAAAATAATAQLMLLIAISPVLKRPASREADRRCPGEGWPETSVALVLALAVAVALAGLRAAVGLLL